MFSCGHFPMVRSVDGPSPGRLITVPSTHLQNGEMPPSRRTELTMRRKLVSILGALILSGVHASGQGIITTVAGNGTAGFGGDGGPATSASLNFPTSVAVDQSGNLYIADMWNHRIRKVSPDGIITTVAGNGTRGFSGDGDLATKAAAELDAFVDLDPVYGIRGLGCGRQPLYRRQRQSAYPQS